MLKINRNAICVIFFAFTLTFLFFSCKPSSNSSVDPSLETEMPDEDKINELSENKCEYGEDSAHWNYQNQSKWTNLCTGSYCSSTRQSPIAIHPNDADKTKVNNKMKFDIQWTNINVEVMHKDYTLQAGKTSEISSAHLFWYPGDSSLSTKEYKLIQLHVHTPSEHIIMDSKEKDSPNCALEVHFVHQNMTDASDLLVVGSRYTGEENLSSRTDSTLSIFANAKDEEILSNYPAINLLPDSTNRSFWNYPGSLTTPGCDTIVTWVVLKETLKVNQSTIDSIKSRYALTVPNSNNARRPQENKATVWFAPNK